MQMNVTTIIGKFIRFEVVCAHDMFDFTKSHLAHCLYPSRTALMIASMKGNVNVVRILLQCNACPNKVDMHGYRGVVGSHKAW